MSLPATPPPSSSSVTAPAESEILDLAGKLGEVVSRHPAIGRYRDARKSVESDPDATRLLRDFSAEYQNLMRQEAQGMPITEAQQLKLQQTQSRIVSHIRIKAMNMAEVEFYDLLRKVTQSIYRQVGAEAMEAAGMSASPGGGGGGRASALV